MSETLTDILNKINSHIHQEMDAGAINRTIGRGMIESYRGQQQIWITNRETKSEYVQIASADYRSIGFSKGHCDTLQGDGTVTSKNSPWGRAILQNSGGELTVRGPIGTIPFTLHNSANYLQEGGDAVRMRIGMNNQGWVNFDRLTEALQKYARSMDELQEKQKAQKAAEEEMKRLEEERVQREKERQNELQRIKDEEERRRIEEEHQREEEERLRKIREEEERIAQIKAERDKLENELASQMEEYAQAASFIRRQATLRFNPVLDKIQDEIKFCNMFNGTTTIINGGPGTGKTTTLIQRLKLLICRLDLQDYIANGELQLTDNQLDIVTDNGGNWIFFSPTELLKEYLKENMNYEGLQDTANKVQVWNTYLSKILRDKYHLVGDNAPFSFKRREHEGTVLIKDDELEIVDEFREYFVNEIRQQLMYVANMDLSQYSWKLIGQNIREVCRKAETASTLRELYIILMSLERYWLTSVLDGKSPDNMISEYYETIKNISLDYIVLWKKERKFYSELLSIYQSDEELEDENDIESDDDFAMADADNKLLLDLRMVLRLLALQHLEPIELDGRKSELYDLISNRIDTEELRKYADIAYFNKHVAPLLRNYVQYLFPLLPKAYKSYRKSQLEEGNANRWNLQLLRRIVVTGDNRPLHPQEQALMLGFINAMLLDIRSISSQRFDEMKHKFADAFKEVCCPVIGIDEATDYCLLDFYAINSLRHYVVSSITMTGDGMQCLKGNGIFEWDMLKDKRLFAKVEVKNLKVSYRQSHELLKLAHSLYRRTLHKIAPYKCYLEDMKKVPRPLWYTNDDEEKKAKWIVLRVLEIKENYGFVPSIAIFVSTKEDADFLVDFIQEQGKLDEAGIEIKNCFEGDKLSDSDTVRIFPTEKVKGMEFEVVFFHNIDHITDMVDRFMYVGLSRATFYMGVTSSTLEDESLLQIQKLFKQRGNWKTLVDDESASERSEETNTPDEPVIELYSNKDEDLTESDTEDTKAETDFDALSDSILEILDEDLDDEDIIETDTRSFKERLSDVGYKQYGTLLHMNEEEHYDCYLNRGEEFILDRLEIEDEEVHRIRIACIPRNSILFHLLCIKDNYDDLVEIEHFSGQYTIIKYNILDETKGEKCERVFNFAGQEQSETDIRVEGEFFYDEDANIVDAPVLPATFNISKNTNNKFSEGGNNLIIETIIDGNVTEIKEIPLFTDFDMLVSFGADYEILLTSPKRVYARVYDIEEEPVLRFDNAGKCIDETFSTIKNNFYTEMRSSDSEKTGKMKFFVVMKLVREQQEASATIDAPIIKQGKLVFNERVKIVMTYGGYYLVDTKHDTAWLLRKREGRSTTGAIWMKSYGSSDDNYYNAIYHINNENFPIATISLESGIIKVESPECNMGILLY